MEVFGIMLSLALLIFVAYRGYSVIFFAPILALLAAFSQGLAPLPAYTELFMERAAGYFKAFFPVFLLGAILGKVMEDTGMAKSIAKEIVKALGKDRGILAIVLAATILTYGGISLFVVVFAVYPFACALFRESGIPKRLIPGAIALGAFTATMTMLPGSPQIQNVIPSTFYGTNTFAAPIIGILATLMQYILGLTWLERRRISAQKAGEGYGNHTKNEPDLAALEREELPDWRLSLIPLIAVIAINYLLTHYSWDPNTLVPFQKMGLKLLAPAIKNVAGIWALIIGLVAGVLLAIIIGFRHFPKNNGLQNALNTGAIGSLLAIVNTSSEVGYGNVISSLPGFKYLADFLLGFKIGNSPLPSEFLTVNILAGITGSASGGMSIALSIMSKDWLIWASQIGLSPEMLHRVASMASGGMDTMPHNGAVITLLAVCGLTHIESYKDIFATSLVIPFITGVAMIAFHLLTGIV